jgi:HEAT repeat protein
MAILGVALVAGSAWLYLGWGPERPRGNGTNAASDAMVEAPPDGGDQGGAATTPGQEVLNVSSSPTPARGDEPGKAHDIDVAALVDVIARARGGDTSLSVTLLIEQMNDATRALSDRRTAGWNLARDGSPEAFAALEAALSEGPAYLRATIAEALGRFQHPQAGPLLRKLLHDGDAVVARGAVRGLAASDDAKALPLLADVLEDSERPVSVRAEAAVHLAELNVQGGAEILLETFHSLSSEDPDLTEALLEGLGTQSFEEIEDLYTELMESSTDGEIRATAVESLSESSAEAVPFLLRVARGDDDPEVRAAAARSVGAIESLGAVTADLVSFLDTEQDAEVRRNLYDAIASQGEATAGEIMALAEEETDPEVRLKAYSSVARLLTSSSLSGDARQFDQTVVPELLDIALADSQLDRRVDALNALMIAKTAGAENALRDVAISDHPMLARAALSALGEP